jgi:hypothetical protein
VEFQQVDGILLAPPQVGAWPKSGLFQWLNFKWVHDFTIQGTGKLDGQGSAWWSPSGVYYIQVCQYRVSIIFSRTKTKKGHAKLKALTFLSLM